MTDRELLAAALGEVTATARRVEGHLARIAAAVERLAPPVPLVEPTPCVRCGGQGWLGARTVPCHVCDGTGQAA